MPGTARPVFISYRREETRHIAGRLADRLAEQLGATQVFIDVDVIEPGFDFTTTIVQEVASCEVLIALIGPTWPTAVDSQGRRRLDDPDDLMVLEIRTALERGIRVIPVLVDDAVLPKRNDLPQGLQDLSRRNALRLDHETFNTDVIPLLNAVKRTLSALAQNTAQPAGGIDDGIIDRTRADRDSLALRRIGRSPRRWIASLGRHTDADTSTSQQLTTSDSDKWPKNRRFFAAALAIMCSGLGALLVILIISRTRTQVPGTHAPSAPAPQPSTACQDFQSAYGSHEHYYFCAKADIVAENVSGSAYTTDAKHLDPGPRGRIVVYVEQCQQDTNNCETITSNQGIAATGLTTSSKPTARGDRYRGCGSFTGAGVAVSPICSNWVTANS